LIVRYLTPEERKEALMDAIQRKTRRQGLPGQDVRMYLVAASGDEFTVQEALDSGELRVVAATSEEEAVEKFVRELLIRRDSFLQYVYDEYCGFSLQDDLVFEVGSEPEVLIPLSEEGAEFGTVLFDPEEEEEEALGTFGWIEEEEDEYETDEEIDSMLEAVQQGRFESGAEEFFLGAPEYAGLYLDYCQNCDQNLPWEEKARQWPFPEDMLIYIALQSSFFSLQVMPIDRLFL